LCVLHFRMLCGLQSFLLFPCSQLFIYLYSPFAGCLVKWSLPSFHHLFLEERSLNDHHLDTLHSPNPDKRLNGRKKFLDMGWNTVSTPLKNPKKIEIKKRKTPKWKREAHIGHPGPIVPRRYPIYTRVHHRNTELSSWLWRWLPGKPAPSRCSMWACRCVWSPELELATAAN
jgi:hypothetical protein